MISNLFKWIDLLFKIYNKKGYKIFLYPFFIVYIFDKRNILEKAKIFYLRENFV